MATRPEARFFDTRADFRRWLEANHDTASELWVGCYKKDSGLSGMSYAEAVNEALCFGWIDGKARSLDAVSYAIRYTPRKRGSNWSAINVRRVGELLAEGRMHPAGLRVFEARSAARTGIYAYENSPAELPAELEAQFRRHSAAWAFFAGQPPSYRRTATWWVVSARRPQTRERRLATLIDDSAHGRRIAQLTQPGRSR
ncbi:YdeI/OmpD-associated family protein [soil metagenome]